VPKLTDTIATQPITVLSWSETGKGKSVLAGLTVRHPELSPVYFLDFDGRVGSLAAVLTPEEMERVYFDHYQDGKLQGSSWTAANLIATDLSRLDKKYGVEFKTIVVDSMSFLLDAIMAAVLFRDGGKPATMTPQIQHYMEQQSFVKEFVKNLNGSGRNIIMTCHEDAQKDDTLGKVFKSFDITGKLANRVPGFFNEIWHSEVIVKTGAATRYAVRVRSDLVYTARTCYKFLPDVVPQADIWGLILKGRGPQAEGEVVEKAVRQTVTQAKV